MTFFWFYVTLCIGVTLGIFLAAALHVSAKAERKADKFAGFSPLDSDSRL